jgi:hypothetical protein
MHVSSMWGMDGSIQEHRLKAVTTVRRPSMDMTSGGPI